ncbi:MAG: carbon-nitrogen hydrolase family protein [Flavitalea sp.]
MKRRYIFYSMMAVLFTVAAGNVNGARYVTVATIGTRPSVDKTDRLQGVVEEVIDFWRGQLKQVLPYNPDLILLTETCDYPRGLSDVDKLKYLNARKNQVLDYFSSVAKANHCYVAFGMQRMAEDGVWRNSSVLLDREGKMVGAYDKNFPTMEEMQGGIKAGSEVPVFDCDFGRVASVICFDLNFDELRQKYVSAKPNIILFSSMYHGGDALQSNWAFSSRSFFVGAMGSGQIPSEVRNPLGDVVASSTNYFDFAVTRINLDYRLAHLDLNWDKLRALKEKYKEAVDITDPGRLGAVLITSNHPTVSAEAMVKEFGIELLDDYFNRSRKMAQQSSEKKK